MKSIDPETKSEIIIVRRGGDNGNEEHHGGAWKIAYADFMTAMMAFFLVMWLVNAASEETKAAVASYFNPIKLVDTHTNPRGIKELQVEGDTGGEGAPENSDGHTGTKQLTSEEESQLMNEPYQALDTIADMRVGREEHYDGQGGIAEGGSQQGSAEGTAYRDPFSPDYWNTNVPQDTVVTDENHDGQVKLSEKNGEDSETSVLAETRVKTRDTKEQIAAVQAAMAEIDQPKPPAPETQASEIKATEKPEKVEEIKASEKTGDDKSTLDTAAQKTDGSGAAAVFKDISDDIAGLIEKQGTDTKPQVRITPVEEGVLVELTDSQNYGMFAVGSAKPDKQTVTLLEGIAKVLAKHQGEVIIAGHTDARPFKTAHYDNWQLSSARAQMAYYMLVRGGLEEKRILRVEGYADRDLRNKTDTYAAENRRISIILKLPDAEKQG